MLGFGNRLRGDDGAGAAVALAVGRWALPGVSVRVEHQLLPEMVEVLAEFDRVFFVDAIEGSGSLACRPLVPRLDHRWTYHGGDPESLLGLCLWLVGRAPDAELLAVPASCFELGASLSASTRAGVSLALVWLRDVLGADMHHIAPAFQPLA